MARREDDAIRDRAYQIWLQEGRPEEGRDARWRQARQEIERRFEQETAEAGEDPARLKYPQAIEEAIEDPGRSQKPGGNQWATTADRRGAP